MGGGGGEGTRAINSFPFAFSNTHVTFPLFFFLFLFDKQWDRAISSLIIRSGLGLSFGVVFSVLLFKRRAWPAWVGLGFGAGRAWEEADGMVTHMFINMSEIALGSLANFGFHGLCSFFPSG